MERGRGLIVLCICLCVGCVHANADTQENLKRAPDRLKLESQVAVGCPITPGVGPEFPVRTAGEFPVRTALSHLSSLEVYFLKEICFCHSRG